MWVAAVRIAHPAVAVLARRPVPCRRSAGRRSTVAAAAAHRAVSAAALVLRFRKVARRRRPLRCQPPSPAAAARRFPCLGVGGGLAAARGAAAPVRGAWGQPAGGRGGSYGWRRQHQGRPGPPGTSSGGWR